MPEYRQSTLIFLLTFTIVSATTIVSFDGKDMSGLSDERNTVYSTAAELWAKVTGCPNTECSCFAVVDNHTEDPYHMRFLKGEKKDIGSVMIAGLQPYTQYNVVLTCSGVNQGESSSKKIQITTDVDRPSAPQELAVNTESNPIQLTWSRPKHPAGPIDHYELRIDQHLINDKIPSDAKSFDLTGHYHSGRQQSLSLRACNKNQQNQTFCSKAEDGQVSVSFPSTTTQSTTVTTTTTTTTTTVTVISTTVSLISSSTSTTSTTPKSFGARSSSISGFLIIFSLVIALF